MLLPQEELRKLYPETKPYKTDALNVDDLHTLSIEEYGNPNGIPVVYLHGGPGAGSSPFYAQYFDPQKYRIILFDQRGSGKSIPKHSMVNNTTWHLVEDIEKIREHLGIKKWAVGGGSWGSTLALVYAEKYPNRVSGLILRGVFLAREADCHAFGEDNTPAAFLHARAWKKLKSEIADLLKQINKPHSSSGKVLDDVYELLVCEDKEVAKKAAVAWSIWEESVSMLEETPQSEIDWAKSEDGLNMGITEVTYMKSLCFIDDKTAILNKENIARINDAGFPVYFFSGKYDLVCPPNQADDLEDALTNRIRYFPLAGHAGDDPGNIDCFVRAADELAIKLEEQLSINVTKQSMFKSSAIGFGPLEDSGLKMK